MRRARTLPPLASDEAPRHAMGADWVDPDDTRPNAARAPRRVRGWRTFCPLRRMSGHPASGITEQHILAADRFREQVDLATLGYSSERPLIYVAQFALPRWGMGPAAIAQLQAVREVRRVLQFFTPPELAMVNAILLRNISLREWVRRTDPPLHPVTEKQKLLTVLNLLVWCYEDELKAEIESGRRLLP